MTMRRAAGLLLGLVASLVAVPAQAAEPVLSLSVTQRWATQPQPGNWSPYTITLKDEGGSDFTGDIYLVAHQSKFNGSGPSWPTYQARLTVGRGTERSLTIFAIEAPSGYRAEVHDTSGKVLATAEPQTVARSGVTVGVLSDDASADSTLRNLSVLQVPISATRFPSAQSFPTNAAYLTGLQAIAIDDFDTSALSQAQIQALRDFVGFGGSLVVGSGASWRRSMLALPAELLPLKPTGTISESMAPLADLGGRSTDLAAATAIGDLVGGRSVLEGADHIPLVIEGNYGAGQVLVLAYDPLAEPIASDPNLSALAWAQGLTRPLLNSAQTKGFGPTIGTTVPFTQGGQAGVAAPAPPNVRLLSGPPAEYQIWQYLRDTPAAAAPPVALLGGLLVVYVLLVGPLTYLVLKGFGRRELAWIAVPAMAMLVTFGTYALGFGSRGGDFIDNEVEVQRLAPTGDVQATAFHALFLPRRGDYTVDLPANTLATTGADALYGGMSTQAENDSVVSGSRARVLLKDVAVWSMRSLETVSVVRQPVAVEASLSMAHARLQGKLTNRGQKALQQVRLYDQSGQEAIVTADIPPGTSVSVDTTFQSVPASVIRAFQGPSNNLTPEEKREAMMVIAGSGAMQRADDLALVAVTDALPAPTVSGTTPNRTSTALVVAPVRLQSADQLPSGFVSPNLVSVATAVPNWVDVYDLEMPAGITQQLTLRYVTPNLQGRTSQLLPGTVEVYDWSASAWRPLAISSARQGSTILEAGERAGGIVRVRVREASPINQAQLQIVSGTAGG